MLALLGFVLLASGLFVRAQDADLKAVLRKAIEAHGGEQNLAKITTVNSKFKGTMELMGATVDVVGETTFQKPDKLRNVMTLEIQGKNVEIVTVFNGQKLWVVVAGTTREIDDETILKETREGLLLESSGGLSDLLKEPYTLSAVGEVKVMGKDAVGIRASKKGQRDINLFFDKKTHLIVKIETRGLDPMSRQEVTQEKYVTSYQDKGGMKVPKEVEIHKDGKKFMAIELTELKSLDRLDNSTFEKP
jgi:outer membrane lipoprotein-sorting protein